ncbi:C-5 cytosine methyltransferase DmtA [Talaromyces proteolyticus]|uniref:DNA (cytosine-5-)-methyltransferase n=1 Tax=Talaromyces proteolyticus TaxID=1131652 RepID=A0AAD4KN12_9EURO|nr:C-5 cytosine methyltransferase DmtA [Talaromyces proteolyticus]KAH8695199.1 C-5 cytosine methyltransferase DmtA [Talaromyces proteolyticus]
MFPKNHPPVVNILQQNIIVRQIPTTYIDDSDSETEAGSAQDESEEQDIDEDDCMTDEDFARFLANWSEEQSVRAETPATQPLEISLSDYNGLMPGMSVELLEDDFLRITKILRYRTGEVKLRGYYFKRLDNLPILFPKERDRELCWLVNEDTEGTVSFEHEVGVNDVQDVPDIVLTNRPWKDQVVPTPSSYVCRFIWHATLDKGEWIIRYLLPTESDRLFRVSSSGLRREWRGRTIPYGSVQNTNSAEHRPRNLHPKLQRQYTFGDVFCGAGGVSHGAWEAGLRIKYGVDIDERACETYCKNFIHSICEYSDFNSWLTLPVNEVKVDISHSSPPCQTFSPAHTTSRNIERDEANSSLIFTPCDMVKKVKPRIHTLEETFGLASRHKETFYTLVQGLLECGYSIHSKVVSCEKYGIPQIRKRLVIIAAGPGDKLPQFPAPTHGPGLRPYVTIQDVIDKISPDAPDHSLANTAFQNCVAKAPYDPNSLARTITCGGGERNYHPSGLRNFTIRELACLQTFHPQYRFSASYAKKQIGNAVPPRLAQAIYQAAIQSLQETDESELAEPIVIE